MVDVSNTPPQGDMAFGAAEQPPEYTNLDTTNISSLPDPVLTQRANRADFALGDKSPGPVVLKDAFRNGQEPQVRQQAAADANITFQQDKLDHIKAAQSQSAPISDTDVNQIMAYGTTPEANPNTVIEDKFAKNIVSAGVIGDPANNLVFQSAFDQVPDETRTGVQMATAAVSRKVQAQGVLEEAQAAYSDVPWFHTQGDQQSKAGELAISILSGGIAQAVNQRNLLNASPTNSFLPGSNKLEQIQYLYLLPHDQFKPALMAAAGPGSELWKTAPGDALDFIKSAVQFSTSDAYADNLLGVANVAGALTAGSQLRSGMRAVQSLGRFVSGAAVKEAGVQSMDAALKTAQDVLSSSSAPKKVNSNFTAGSPTGQDGINAAWNAVDILSTNPKPQAAGYYVPKAAVVKQDLTASKTNPPTVARNITTSVGADGIPHVYNEDGIEVQLSRLPEEGHLPVSVSPGTKPTYTTREGTTEHTPQTIYVNKDGADRLSKVLDTEGPRKTILQQPDGRYAVGDLDNQTPGKTIRGTITNAQNTPGRGLYPIELTDDGAKFGQKITRVDAGEHQNVSFGPEIVAKENYEARVALSDVIKSQAETNSQDVLSKMGQHEAASDAGANTVLNQRLGGVVPQGDVESIRRQVPSLASPQLYYSNASSLTRERADRLAQNAIQSSNQLSQAIVDPVRVERLTPQAQERAIQIAKDQVRQKYNRNADAILDQQDHWDSASNTTYVETKFGKKDGTLFDSSAQATHYQNLQYRLGQSATVQQEGNQFYLSHIQHIDETQSGVRNTLIVSGNETPRGWWNSLATAVTGKFAPLGNSIRSSAYTVSPFQMNNRVVTTQAPSIMRNAIESVAQDLKLGHWTTNERQEMQTILEHNRDYMSPDGVRGQFYKDALSFETEFNSRFGKMPTEKQIVAYDQFTRLSDLDWTLRELDSIRDKTRLGVRNYKVTFAGKDDLGMPANLKTDWFNGKLVQDFDPKATPNANVYIMPEGRFTTKYDLKKGDAVSSAINDKLKSGEYQIIQAYAPREKPLMATTGVKDDVHFIVTNKYEDKAVEFGENVPYRPGGHVIYQDMHYLKQPKIGPGTNGATTHFGDTSIKAFSTEREANQWADKYNIVRNLIRTNDEAGLKAYIDAGNLPETLPEIKRMFSDGTLSTEHPIVHTFAGRDTLQSNEALARAYPGLKDTFSAYNLSQVQSGEFLADRGAQLNTIANKGTEANPLYTNVPSRLYDPFTALQKGMAQIVRSRWMSDYKISAAESWVQEFGMLFDQSKLPIEKLRQNPIYWINHAPGNIDAGVMKTNPELVTAAMTSRKNIMNFIGSRDEVGALMDGLRNKMIDGIAGIAGNNVARKVEETYLPAITNAPEYARQSAFHAVIGLFNPVQLWQQAQGLAHVYALAPEHAWHSTTASTLVRLYRHTEDASILDDAANKAAAMGWDKAEFLEALDGWKRSGVHNIGGETALLSTTADPQLFKNAGSSFLDKGLLFFKAGESIVRDTSWFTAYREWKASNPGKALDNRSLGDIGNRYQTLSLDMTRASNSALNEGILSVPTQFWTWNTRFAEQMLSGGLGNSGRLTLGEKARVFTTYAAMYGIPATLGGITFGAIPDANYGDIRQYALANNINVSSKWYQLFSEGLGPMIMNAITGHETSMQRFGPNATQLKDIIDGKKDAAEILGGASGSFVAQVAKTAWPAMMYGFSAFKKDSGFPLKMNDLVNLAENSSTFNNAEKAVRAWNTGTYVSKTEGIVDSNVDKFEAVMLGLGLNPQRVNDAYTKQDFNKAQKTQGEKAGKIMSQDWTIAMKAGAQGDYQTMADYMTRVHAQSVMSGLTKAQEIQIFQQAMRGNESMVDSVEKKFREMNPNLQSVPAYKLYLENRH